MTSIRRAETRDAAAIAAIYNHYVLETTVTFDEVPWTVESRVAWMAQSDPRHVILVAEGADGVIGWAALRPYRERPAWRHTAEVAVYLAPDATGAGLGGRLLDALIAEARAGGLHALVSQITADNAASIKLTERAGFVRIGMMSEVGFKFGRWIDLVIFEMLLGDGGGAT